MHVVSDEVDAAAAGCRVYRVVFDDHVVTTGGVDTIGTCVRVRRDVVQGDVHVVACCDADGISV